MSMSCAMTSILALPTERPFVSREYANGTYTAGSYWCARCVVCLGVCTLVGVLTTPIWYFLIGVSMGPRTPCDNDSLDISGLRLYDLREYCGSAVFDAHRRRELRRTFVNGHAFAKWHHDHAAQDQSLFYPFYLINPQSWLCYIIVEAVTHGHPRGDHVMDYFQYKKGQIGASFCALLAIDAGAILLGWAVLTHAFAAEVDGVRTERRGEGRDVRRRRRRGGDDDFVRKPPRRRTARSAARGDLLAALCVVNSGIPDYSSGAYRRCYAAEAVATRRGPAYRP